MGLKAIPTTEVFALIDEQTLRHTLARIEQLRMTPEAEGLCYGAVVTLTITPEQLAGQTAMMDRCRVRAGGWTDELPPSTRPPRGGLSA